MNIVDNILVVNNVSEKISFVYDIKKTNPVQPIGIPQSLPIYENSPSTDDKTVVSSETNLSLTSTKLNEEISSIRSEEENKENSTNTESQTVENSVVSTEGGETNHIESNLGDEVIRESQLKPIDTKGLNGHQHANAIRSPTYSSVSIEENPICIYY